MNARFWFTAGVLTGVTATVLVFAAFRSTPALDRASAAGQAAVETMRPEASPTAPATAASTTKAPSMEAATAGLEARLERNGGSAEDWELLAKSYEFLGRSEAAARARQHLASASAPGGVVKSSSASGASMPSVADVARLTARPPAGTQERGP